MFLRFRKKPWFRGIGKGWWRSTPGTLFWAFKHTQMYTPAHKGSCTHTDTYVYMLNNFFLKEENDIKVKGPRKGLVVMLRTRRRVREGICEGDGQAVWAAAFTCTAAT